MARRPLAVMAPMLGVRSETFIQRQMTDLLPGATVVVVDHRRPPEAGHWSVDGPVLILEERLAEGLGGLERFRRCARRLQRRVQRVLLRQGPEPDARMAEVRRFLREQGVQVILSQYLTFSLQWAQVAREVGARFYARGHGWDVSSTLRDVTWRQRYLAYNRQCDGVIVMSRHAAQRLAGIGIDPRKIHVVPYGVDVPAEPPAAAADHSSGGVGGGGPVRCVAVGRMVGKKAPLLTLEAFRQASAHVPDLQLDYVGAGPLLEPARQFVQTHGLTDRVRLHGAQPPSFVQDLMRRGDLFLQHSMPDPDTGDEEGMPVAILEAMASALPVVSTRHAGIPEEVEEAVSGYLVNERDVQAMAERIAELAADPQRRRRFGLAAWQRCRERFSWERERADLLRVTGLG